MIKRRIDGHKDATADIRTQNPGDVHTDVHNGWLFLNKYGKRTHARSDGINRRTRTHLGLAAVAGAEVLGDHSALHADIEPGDLVVDNEAGELLVERDAGHELVLRLVWLPVLHREEED